MNVTKMNVTIIANRVFIVFMFICGVMILLGIHNMQDAIDAEQKIKTEFCDKYSSHQYDYIYTNHGEYCGDKEFVCNQNLSKCYFVK